MSKLSDAIRRAGRTAPTPLGFAARPALATTSPTVLCIVRLNSSEANKAEEATKKGADAVIIEGADAGAVAATNFRGADAAMQAFFAQNGTYAGGTLPPGSGVFLVRSDADDTRLRLLNDLNLDALVPPPPNGSLTIERLLELRRFSALGRTPLLVEVSGEADGFSIQALRESGVAGLIIEGSSLGKLEKLRAAIAAMPPRGRQPDERREAMIPAPAMAGHDHDDDDFDDD